METKSSPWQTALVAAFLMASPIATASDSIDEGSGFCTARLSAKHLQIWKTVEKLVPAQDKAGRPLHPRLESLWRWAGQSGHVIYLEMTSEKNLPVYHAGKLFFERIDTAGGRHELVIRFNLSVIDGAQVQEQVRRSDGFLPFEGLDRMHRYAQVLGHELERARLLVEDPVYMGVHTEMEREVREFYECRKRSAGGRSYSEEALQHLTRIQSLTVQFEKPAQTAEATIWRELLGRTR
jgi:hypothetical protein